MRSVRYSGREAMGVPGEERAWMETGRETEGDALEPSFEGEPRDFPAGPVAKTPLPMQGAPAPSLVRELDST